MIGDHMKKLKNNKAVQPIAHKRAITQVQKYNEKKTQGENLYNEKLEKFSSDIAPFLTKKGELRKNISQKRLEEFNKIVSEYKQDTAPSIADREENRRKRTEAKKRKKRVETSVRRGLYTEEESIKILNQFKIEAVRELSNKKYLDSSQVLALMKEFRFGKKQVSRKDFEKVAKYIIEAKKKIPNEVSGLSTQDDMNMLAETLLRDINKINFDVLYEELEDNKIYKFKNNK